MISISCSKNKIVNTNIARTFHAPYMNMKISSIHIAKYDQEKWTWLLWTHECENMKKGSSQKNV